jgi:tyrosyl-tRNA synthetase
MTDQNKLIQEIDELLSRSVQSVLPNKEELKKLLLSGRKLRVYIGADATGPDLHLGHSTNYLLLEKFRQLGHTTFVLFGDFTAMIGDPSDKSDVARKPLTKKEVGSNIQTWKKQLNPIMSFGSFGNKTKIVKNSTWLSKLSFADVVKLSSNFTVQQMLERDMFQKRMEAKQPLFLQEFLYPLMQGYDSVALDVDIEIGGNDQTFNMMAGRVLQRSYNNKNKFVIATTLLTNPKTGKKLMSKSEGGYVSLQDSPQDMFGKIMALPDEVMIQMFIDCTTKSLKEIELIKQAIENGKNPRDIKLDLAFEIVSTYHGKTKAERAKGNFINTFSEKKISEDVKIIEIKGEHFLSNILVQEKIINSKSDFVRLVREGAITNLLTNEKISDIHFKVITGTYKIGKHRFIKIQVVS